MSKRKAATKKESTKATKEMKRTGEKIITLVHAGETDASSPSESMASERRRAEEEKLELLFLLFIFFSLSVSLSDSPPFSSLLLLRFLIHVQ